jgi:hypothetical protein
MRQASQLPKEDGNFQGGPPISGGLFLFYKCKLQPGKGDRFNEK